MLRPLCEVTFESWLGGEKPGCGPCTLVATIDCVFHFVDFLVVFLCTF